MKHHQYGFFCLAILFAPVLINAQEQYLRFVEKDRTLINERITRTVSIDRITNDTIYAYASPEELFNLAKLGYTPELLPHPSSLAKNIVMATTLAEMAGWDRYPTYEVYLALMKRFEADYPNLCRLDSIGTTVQGRKLYTLHITNHASTNPKPYVLYTSTMHGNETTGFVLLLRLAHYLLSNYGSNLRATAMVNGMNIFINPNANPDGTYIAGNHTVSGSTRSNANLKDLNRNFPDPRVGSNPDGPHQPETLAMMAFAGRHNFSLSANLHGGIELANFPWDTWESIIKPHPDHAWFYNVSRQYANLAQSNSPSGYFTGENNGVTHGGDWYVIAGGRQDYMNFWHGCREITLELSNAMLLASNLLPALWDYNRDALLTYLERVFGGFNGTVTNIRGEPLSARARVLNHDRDNSEVRTNLTTGAYYRMIEPGQWYVEYSATGYASQTHTITIPDWETSVTQNITLLRNLNLSVVVRDANNSLPIEGVRVELLDYSAPVLTTSQDGTCMFPNVTEGLRSVRVSKRGYIAHRASLALSPSSSTLSFMLHPSEPESFENPSPPLGFTSEGGEWLIDATTAQAGHKSLQSPSLSSNQTSTLSLPLTITQAGDVSFALHIGGGGSGNRLRFLLNSQELGQWSGAQPWSDVSFPVVAGEHLFTWEWANTGVNSVGNSTAWLDSIIFPLSSQDVAFTVSHGEVPIEGAWVAFNGSTRSTNSEGTTLFAGVERGTKLPYQVSMPNFIPSTGEVTIRYTNLAVPVSIEQGKSRFNISFIITGQGEVLSEAIIVFGDTTLITSTLGEAYLQNIEAGEYTYQVSCDRFLIQEGSLLVGSDTTFIIILIPETGSYTLSVSLRDDRNNPLDDVIVALEDEHKTPIAVQNTDALGWAFFNSLVGGVYNLSASLTGFDDLDTTIHLTSDSIIDFKLIRLNSQLLHRQPHAVRLWPNPSMGEIYISSYGLENNLVRVEIVSAATGKIVSLNAQPKYQGHNTYRLDLKGLGLPAGLYIVRVVLRGNVHSQRVMLAP